MSMAFRVPDTYCMKYVRLFTSRRDVEVICMLKLPICMVPSLLKGVILAFGIARVARVVRYNEDGKSSNRIAYYRDFAS